ncbi:TonB-linked SusC/RagA family outer membrane protein [Filimonas zeae]|uniref:SusC/RagA family TonB-linked outer membrane protein n=1 Tax=Filimonas zeae TaxID=1737353 RepID=A0A917IT61_9BACT|nr:SusC/RagA family TonB-linked outer membrane protein [Filimonas zeae]MDR6338164.1 TonB-linked SusC/RagA family outer membrane protein [Filimonas zeae]GGH62038.1 SusC/RagA family TonB-linked outer membrane protein [Filimonas zeae]
MKKKFQNILSCLLPVIGLLTATASFSQSATAVVTGTVVTEKGEMLAGVHISASRQGSNDNVSAVSDAKGIFIFKQLTATAKYDFTFSYVGYAKQVMNNVTVEAGKNNSLFVKLKEQGNDLNQVTVVTALGIKRKERSLGYSVGKLDEDDVSTVKQVNVLNSISGRIAGVNVVSTGTDPGSTVKVVIRGESSLMKNNQPLYVVDGVPVAKSPEGASAPVGRTVVDFGSPIADINPSDIESITVLKGASAAALYGGKAGNGVILITTKAGKKGQKGLGVSVNSDIVWDKAWQFPHFQNEYGYGSFPGTTDVALASGSAWGPKLNTGEKRIQWNSPVDAGGQKVATDWVAYPDRARDFFNTGLTATNNVAFAGSSDKGTFRLSYTNMYNRGIVPNTGLKRNTVVVAAGYQLAKGVTVNTNISYANNYAPNRPGAYRESVTEVLYKMAPNTGLAQLKNYWKPGRVGFEQFTHDPGNLDNPYFIAYEQINGYNRDHLTGNIQMNIAITADLNLMVRTGIDLYNQKAEVKRPFSAKRTALGAYSLSGVFYKQQNSDFLLSYKKKLHSNWVVSASAGGNLMDEQSNSTSQIAGSLTIPNIYNIGNARAGSLSVSQGFSQKRINSLYGTAQIAYHDYLFVDASGRNDWSSALPAGNNSYFYPSVSVSGIVTDMLKMPEDVLSYAKIRANWARVGKDTDPYSLYNTIAFNSDWGSVKRATIESALKNNFLKPEIATSYELGTELRFLHNRIGLDVTWYKTNNRNQIINISTTRASGFSGRLINAGNIQNQGWELGLSATPVKGKLQWDIHANFTRNVNKVVELAPGVPEFSMGSADGENILYTVKEGTQIGDMYTPTWVTIKDGPLAGQPLLDKNGRYQRTTDVVKAGNYNPDFRMGFENTFSYKNFTLNALFDWRKGGSFYSYVVKTLINEGLTTNTLEGRDAAHGGLAWVDGQGNKRNDGMIIPGYIANADGSYAKNTNVLAASDFYTTTYNKYYQRLTYSASFLKLREVSLVYVFPRKVLGNLPVNNLSLAVIGRNLYTWTANKLGYDPETSLSVDTDGFKQGVGHWTLPGTRSYGVKLSCNF